MWAHMVPKRLVTKAQRRTTPVACNVKQLRRVPMIMDGTRKEESRCFVCDAEVRGRYYALATCKTQSSRSRAIEKLGELVGERYMVVISEDDVICRSCASLINTLDRLEMEMRNIRDHVLRFLEQKYSLEEGELRGNSDIPKPCQPPQITKSDAKEITSYCTKQSEIDFESYLNDKRKRKRSHTWLQCDKCKYTTRLNTFMMHHVRNAKEKMFCDKYGLAIIGNPEEMRHACRRNESENKENEKDNSAIVVGNKTMEMTSLLQRTMPQTIPYTQTTPPPLIGLSSCDHLYVSNTSPSENNSTRFKQIYILQSTSDMGNTVSSEMTKPSKSVPVKYI